MIEINEWRLIAEDFKLAGAPMIIQVAQMNEILDRLEVAEQTAQDYLRIDGEKIMLALHAEMLQAELNAQLAELAQLHEVADKFNDGIDWIQRALQAEAMLEEAGRQEPVAWMNSRNGFITKDNKNPDYNLPLYLAPGAKENPQ